MRRIERTGAFHRDFKREKRGHYRLELEGLLTLIISVPAGERCRNEIVITLLEGIGATTGNVRSSQIYCWPLICRKPDPEVLQLIRRGSQSELFG